MTKDEALDLALKTLRSVAGELYRVTSYCDTYDALAETNNAIMDIQQARSAPVQDSTCNETLRAQGKVYPRTCKKCGKGPCIGAPKQPPAQPAPDLQAELEATNRQVEILSDILAESRWEVAALKVNAALDKKAENARELGLDYEPAPKQRWAVFCRFCNKEWSVSYKHPGKSVCVDCDNAPPAQRQFVGLTDEERGQAINANFGTGLWRMAKDIEAKLRSKNND